MKRIIIIDDDPGIQEAFRILFESTGYQVIIYPDAGKLFEEHIPADLYIIDKQLSGIDGLELCKHLKSQQATRHIPVIMLSASPSIVRLSQLAGADDAIEKPFSIKQMRQKVDQYLRLNTTV